MSTIGQIALEAGYTMFVCLGVFGMSLCIMRAFCVGIIYLFPEGGVKI